MFTKPQKLILVRHGAYRDDGSLNPDLLPYLDRSAMNIGALLAREAIGRAVLLTSPVRRTLETAEYIGERLAENHEVSSDLIESSQLATGSTLDGVYRHAWEKGSQELSDYIDTLIDDSSAVIAVTHQPIIQNIAYVMDVEPDVMYGGITVVK